MVRSRKKAATRSLNRTPLAVRGAQAAVTALEAAEQATALAGKPVERLDDPEQGEPAGSHGHPEVAPQRRAEAWPTAGSGARTSDRFGMLPRLVFYLNIGALAEPEPPSEFRTLFIIPSPRIPTIGCMKSATQLTHIVVATDESEAGRQAVRTAFELAVEVGARVTVLQVVPLGPPGTESARTHLRGWVESDVRTLDRLPPVSYEVACGIPGIEIGRFAERTDADLLVLGRTPRSRTARLLLGDTADAVSRRSRLPCLFVPPRRTRTRRLLVAVDGSDRGMAVLRAADGLGTRIGAEVRVLTVEGAPADELHLGASTPLAHSISARSEVRTSFGQDLEVRRGDPAEQILVAIDQHMPDVLVLGCHRGGPAGVIEAGSIARRLLHSASCAVLTVPL